MPYEAADLELVGGDESKLDALIAKYEPERVRTRQAVIDQKDTELRAFKALGLTPDEIKELKTRKPGENDQDVEKRVKDAISEVTNDFKTRAAAKARASEVRTQAAALGFIKPAQALALLDPKKVAEIPVDDNDDADEAAVKKLLDDLAKESPYLVKNPDDETPGHQAAGVGATGSGGKPETAPGLSRLREAYAETPKK